MKPLLSIVLACSCFTFSARADLLTGLVSYWALDVNNGGLTPDGSFPNNLTVNGAPSTVTGQVGNAFSFNGTVDYLSITHGPSNLDTGLPVYVAGSYTVAMWVKGAGQTAKYLFTEASTLSNNQLLLLQTGNAAGSNTKLDVLIRNDTSTTLLNHVVSTNVVFNNAWHHIAWVDDRGTCRMYVDGSPDAGFTYTPAGTFSFNTTAVGALVRAAVSGFFNGQIDEVAVWERALTAAEVLQVKTSGIPTPIPARAPTFTTQPASSTNNVGDWVLYSANTMGNRPFSYQWNKNGSAILNATDRTWRASNLDTNNTGDFYSVTVSNGAGSTPSTNAVITVVPDPAPAVTNNILSYWPADEVTNTPSVTPDIWSGNHFSLSNMDSTALVIGQFGNALSFDGFSQFAARSGAPVYANPNYSVSLWVKADGNTQNDRRVFSEGNSTNNNPLFTIGTDAAGTSQLASIFIRNDANAAAVNGRKSTRTVFDNNWHHLVWTDANGHGRLYVDGQLDETDYNYPRTPTTMDRNSLGAVLRGAVGNYYFGDIDEVATWNRVLSWTEIQQIMTNGLPHPVGAVAPTIAVQPSDHTNAVFAGDNVLFVVQATGTAPLSYQWLRNGLPINSNNNPSAATEQLTVTNVQAADSGSGFSVIITNVAGSITSRVAQLTVTPYTPVTNGLVLAVDVGASGFPNAQPGYDEMTLTSNPTNFAGVNVTLSAIGTSLAERIRTTPPWVVDNPPDFTQARMFNDFVFGNSTANGTGVRILIERLAPSTLFSLTIFSFDANSAGGRISDWTETASGTPVPIQTGYTFDGNFPPTNNFEQTLGGLVTSSANGKLQIEGVRNGGTSFGAFVNGIRLVAHPVPTTEFLRVATVDTNLVFRVLTAYPNQIVNFEQTTNLDGGTWVPATGGGPVLTNGMVITAAFAITEGQMFYRAVSPSN